MIIREIVRQLIERAYPWVRPYNIQRRVGEYRWVLLLEIHLCNRPTERGVLQHEAMDFIGSFSGAKSNGIKFWSRVLLHEIAIYPAQALDHVFGLGTSLLQRLPVPAAGEAALVAVFPDIHDNFCEELCILR
jgi:hypothetical protein